MTTNTTTRRLLAFHSDPAVKALYLTRVRAHAEADELVRRIYWENGRGCAVGCTVHSADHAAYELELGIPRILARLEDQMFEGMPLAASGSWPERFLSAIPVGADLSGVWPKFAIWLLSDPDYGAIRHSTPAGSDAIVRVVHLFERQLTGGAVTREEWQLARIAASYAAAEAAAGAAASYVAAHAAAVAAAYAAESDARVAAAAAAAAYAYAAVRAAESDAHAAAVAAAYAAESDARVAATATAAAYAAARAAESGARVAAARAATATAAYADALAESYSRQSIKLLELLAAAPVEESK